MGEMRLEEHKRRMEEVKIDIDPECEICMNIIVRPTQLPCQHVYCQYCIKASMSLKWECPKCRLMPALNFNFPINTDLIEKFKEQVEP